ncbi:MAG: hypothetical protein K2X27_22380 [Candidatus Obscuribacterales bacterium]|nr:hypothetical protein [Candidatus Obscuribacterales bacterium]
MSDGRYTGPGQLDNIDAINRAADRIFGKKNDAPSPGDSSTSSGGSSSLDRLREQALGRPSPWAERPKAGSDSRSDRPQAPVSANGTIEISYGDPDFDAKLAQTNYRKVKINNLPKDFLPSPWVDDSGKGFFFWFKNQKNPDASDRSKHYFPGNVKEIEIARNAGNGGVYKPVLINADEMRISASQEFMRINSDSGFASYRNTTDALGYAKNISKAASGALDYQEKLLREGAKNAPENPYFRIYLADVLVGQAIQPVLEAIGKGEKAYFDNPYTRQKIDDAITEIRAAREVTRVYGDIRKPPAYEMPLSPFGLNPYAYNPDYYWSGAAYQASIREVQLTLLKQAVIYGKLPIELPPALPPRP